MQPERRQVLIRVLLFAFLLGLGAWPWDSVRIGFSRALSAVGNPLLERLPVVQNVQLHLEPLLQVEQRTADESIQTDTLVALGAPGQAGKASLGLSLRRDAYLPLVIFVAALVALPLSWRSRLPCLAAGSALILITALLSVWVLVIYLVGQQTNALPAWESQFASLVFECWLTPPGNRVIAPLLLAAGLGLFARRHGSEPRLRRLPWETAGAGSPGPRFDT